MFGFNQGRAKPGTWMIFMQVFWNVCSSLDRVYADDDDSVPAGSQSRWVAVFLIILRLYANHQSKRSTLAKIYRSFPVVAEGRVQLNRTAEVNRRQAPQSACGVCGVVLAARLSSLPPFPFHGLTLYSAMTP
jgi:hypothetical protein